MEESIKTIQLNENSWSFESDIVRAFLFTGSEKALVGDTTNVICDLMEEARKLTALPVMLVNTHADGDHIAANRFFEAAYMHPSEYAYYERMKNEEDPAAFPLQDGEIIDLGGRQFEVVLAPGHTFGSIALIDLTNRILVSGDSISEGPVFMFGDMRSLEAYKVSLRRLLEKADLYDTVYPSHGPLPLEKSQITNLLCCAEKLSEGKLEPQDPPFPIPAKMYCSDNAALLYVP